MVFKADDHAAARGGRAFEFIIADHAFLCADRAEVERTDKIAALAVEGLVSMAHHLVAAADREKHDAVARRRADLSVAAAVEVVEQDLLLKILAAADKDDVIARERGRRAEGHLGHLGAEAAPDKALLHTADVAAIAVEIQDIGIQMADLQFHFPFPPYSQNSAPPKWRIITPRSSSIAV